VRTWRRRWGRRIGSWRWSSCPTTYEESSCSKQDETSYSSGQGAHLHLQLAAILGAGVGCRASGEGLHIDSGRDRLPRPLHVQNQSFREGRHAGEINLPAPSASLRAGSVSAKGAETKDWSPPDEITCKAGPAMCLRMRWVVRTIKGSPNVSAGNWVGQPDCDPQFDQRLSRHAQPARFPIQGIHHPSRENQRSLASDRYQHAAPCSDRVHLRLSRLYQTCGQMSSLS
jgi:hypothetical protein